MIYNLKVFGSSICEKGCIKVSGCSRVMGSTCREVKIWGINDLLPALIHPDLFLYRLAVRTVPIPTGIIVDYYVSAVLVLGDRDPQVAGLAVHDRMCCHLLDREGSRGSTKGFPVLLKDLLDLILGYDIHLPVCPAGLQHKLYHSKPDGRNNYNKHVIITICRWHQRYL